MKLRVLPDPDRFFLLLPLSVQAEMLNFILSRILADEAIQQLKPLQGKSFLFRTPKGEISLLMSIGEDRLQVHKPGVRAPDVTIEGDALALFSLCFGLEDSDSLFFSRRLLLTGDTAAGLLFKNVLANIDFDLKYEMEKRFGRTLTAALWRMAPAGIRGVEALDQQLASWRDALLRQTGLATHDEIQDLKRHAAEMEKAQASLVRRMDRLEKRPRRPGRQEAHA